jgi:hypothetical protein
MILDRPTNFTLSAASDVYHATDDMIWNKIKAKTNVERIMISDLITIARQNIRPQMSMEALNREIQQACAWILMKFETGPRKCIGIPSSLPLPSSTLSTSELGSRIR